jgi:hypothetical protein
MGAECMKQSSKAFLGNFSLLPTLDAYQKQMSALKFKSYAHNKLIRERHPMHTQDDLTA